MKTHFEKLERMYLGAKYNQLHFPSTTVQISEGAAIITLDVGSEYFHALEATHGSVYFKLLDDAAYFAANSLETSVFLLTAEFNIKLKRPFKEGLLIARGEMKSEEQGRIYASATLESESGKLIAEGHGQFARSKSPLAPEIGYI
jgi:uncharacterized protein (TIGR00369 family)